MLDGKQLKDNSILPGKIDLTTASAGTHPASRSYVDTQVNAAKAGLAVRDPVRVATNTNVNLASPGASIDGVALTVGDSFLVFGQTTGSQNGIYVFNGAASQANRRTLEDASAEIIPSMIFLCQEGTYADKMFRLTTNAPITLGTTVLTFTVESTLSGANPSLSNKFMTAVATTNDFDVACNTGMAASPAANSYVQVDVNGVLEEVGDGVKTKACYFSGDSGANARARNAVASGDKLYWVGSVAGYQLTAQDKVSFSYNV